MFYEYDLIFWITFSFFITFEMTKIAAFSTSYISYFPTECLVTEIKLSRKKVKTSYFKKSKKY